MAASAENSSTSSVLDFGQRLQMLAYSLIVFSLIVYLLREFASVLQPLFIAVFLGYLVIPARRWLTRRGVPVIWAYGILTLVLILSILMVTQLVVSSVRDFRTRLPIYEERFQIQAVWLATIVPGTNPDAIGKSVESFFGDPERVNQMVGRILGTTFDSMVGILSLLGVILVFLMFWLAEQATFEKRIIRALTGQRSSQVLAIVKTINSAIARYIAVKTFVSLLTGILTGLALWIFDVDFTILWSVLTFVANFIPYLGSFVAVLLPVLLDWVQTGSLVHAAALLLILTGVQQFIGIVVEPWLIGKRLDLSPLVVILSLAFWGSLWGIPGMILAVPLVVVMRTILANIPQTMFLAILLANPDEPLTQGSVLDDQFVDGT
ncbi:Uncharacterized protein OS=Isosphaera pallida (strain ATCC 43644 / DSM 9630 / IS1B) GN=Isop_1687 PE=4 SV=1: UPF0118 [Tuwongella immobilis]|uniref:AI-2E family transporter n=2 Tax=Tuwongella immobilis TaxID=692036 RepID=A0A6C2YQY3_9BACT|nr:Uncharacterized protein OS=Isosphaera pallida (strain ATCC 43644 / DSM 9630 / IS1B) GN=Isop_1687 PE=4 SV=1: UPF0118 [Tuwongella immobilis]VTS04394.1 Uncharacterized protein OS=Isosphaera pallida (strain ATCC 43644 / DSM 9630 / IS1B) GN=Isop_1687 PE=4 SV=1: UPF0118 [Tuwongella immobilis]